MTPTLIIISLILCLSVYVLGYRAWKRRNWWAWYRRYLQSAAWGLKRAEKLALADYRCDKAYTGNCSGWLEVHHKNYKHVGHENMSDLVVLCKKHHDEVKR